jgi:hypothetical protein
MLIAISAIVCLAAEPAECKMKYLDAAIPAEGSELCSTRESVEHIYDLWENKGYVVAHLRCRVVGNG